MSKTVLEAYNAEREIENLTYKNLLVMIVSILGIGLAIHLLFCLYVGKINEYNPKRTKY
ncbi:hypothetical protein IIM_03869 [Bacillus cereus VD107]|nr:hypothetical protein IIM_03869 [Bacillus cereus VD107]